MVKKPLWLGSLPTDQSQSCLLWEYEIRIIKSWESKTSISLAGVQSVTQWRHAGCKASSVFVLPLCLTSLSAWDFLPCSLNLLPFISPVTSAPFPLVHYSSNFSPMPQYHFFPLSSLFSGECPVIVVAASEARLPVTAGGGWRTWEHHNVWWRGRGWGRHCRLWHCRPSECPTQLTLTWLSHTGQQECVSRQLEHVSLHVVMH